ncbi:MAG: SLC13 family permease, partial [Desulfobacterales bacterium]|nr:SLC13 family permease [Desulfobacterales bacterium]
MTFLTPYLPAGITPDMAIVFGFLILVTFLFITEKVRVDMVGLLMMVLLPLSGVISPSEAIRGLSSNAVVSIIAVIIIGHGLDKTGVMNVLAKQIVSLSGKSPLRMTSLISATVAVISSFMQNIGAAALFLPAVNRMCRQLNVPISKVLIPMGYCAVIGGCLTLVGSSPLILLNDLMASWWNHNPNIPNGSPFGLFDVAPIGLALILTALAYFALVGRWILPKAQASEDACTLLNHDLACTYGREVSKIFEMVVPMNFYTRRLEELKLRPRFHATVVCISKRKGRYRVLVPGRADVIEPNDVVGIVANRDHAVVMADTLGWELAPDLDKLNGILSADRSGIIEA